MQQSQCAACQFKFLATFAQRWHDETALLASLSPDDSVLFEKPQWLIGEFDWLIPMESRSVGEGQLCDIVWNTIKLVRNGDDTDEVIRHLKKHGRIWPDEIIARNLREIKQIRDNPEKRDKTEQRIAILERDIKWELDKKDSFIKHCTETAQKIVELIRKN